MVIEEQEAPPHIGTIRISYASPTVPHWGFEYVEGDRPAIDDLARRAQAVITLLPPGDPQFRRNKERVQRDGDREGITIEWVGTGYDNEPPREPRERRD